MSPCHLGEIENINEKLVVEHLYGYEQERVYNLLVL